MAGQLPAEPSVQYATPLWRALIGLRIVTLVYAMTLVMHSYRALARPVTALVALAAMVLWTAVMSVANGRQRSRRWRWSVADLAVAAGMLLLTAYVDGSSGLLAHSLTLTGPWTAAPVLSCGVLGGPWLGLLASSAIVAATIALPGTWWDVDTLDNLMILASAAAAVGLVARLLERTQAQLRRLVAQRAATAERDRLARPIHDGVLQLLALLERDGPGLGERGARLARLAGTEQAALRALMSREPAPDTGQDPAATVDLNAVLAGLAAPDVQLVTAADPVPLPAQVAAELRSAVATALDNVARHAGPGAHAWVVVETVPGEVVLTIRDDGPGISPGRLATATATGRLGVAQSMRGRIADLGGTTTITTCPGEGTEVEFRIPTAHPAR